MYLVCVQHQQQVAAAVERAKQVTMQELNAIIGVSSQPSRSSVVGVKYVQYI